jgi:hypothetical protein
VISFAISTGISTHILEKLPIPKFDVTNTLHKELADLSTDCHKLASKGDQLAIGEAETRVDNAVASLWRIRANQLATIQATLTELESGGDEEEE